MTDFARFLEIRKLYEMLLPKWMDEYNHTGNMMHNPYYIDFQSDFTPIEQSVWCDIRGAGLPFYPQIPVLNYFVDFGCPFKKIAIECDGYQWHDSKRDRIRDSRLAAEGWSVFRIPGHKCKKVMNRPYDNCDHDEDMSDTKEWYATTSEGLIYAIGNAFFYSQRFSIPERDKQVAIMALRQSCTTGIEYVDCYKTKKNKGLAEYL